GKFPLCEPIDDFHARLLGLVGFARLDHVVPLPALRIRKQLRLPREEVSEETHVVRMIGDDQEIERPRELGRLPVGGDDLLAFGKAVGFTWPEATTGSARIE